MFHSEAVSSSASPLSGPDGLAPGHEATGVFGARDQTMKADIYIHIGLPKTGSTSIQDTLFKNRGLLRRHDLHYFGACVNHTVLITQFRKQLRWPHEWMRLTGEASVELGKKRAAEIGAALRHELETNTCGRFVLSGEGLCNLKPDEIEQFKDALLPFAAKFRIVAYVRDPYSFMSSAFQQRLRGGDSFESIAARPPLPMYRRIGKFIHSFGRSNVDIRIFDRQRFTGGDLIADFLSAVGTSPGIAEELDIVRSNLGLSHEAAILLNEINTLYPRHADRNPNPERATDLIAWLATVPGQTFRCPPGVLDVAEPVIQKDLRWLRDVLGEQVFTERPEPGDLSPNWNDETLAALGKLINEMANRIAQAEGAADRRLAGKDLPRLGFIARLWPKLAPIGDLAPIRWRRQA